jgi:hypothetical protein
MKQIFFTLVAFVAFSFNSSAQVNYADVMARLIAGGQVNTSEADLNTTVNQLERIANAEPKEWLPNYYSALFTLTNAFKQKDASLVDAIVDKADAFLAKAVAVAGENNSEIITLQAMALSARIMVDPMSRGMKFGMQSAQLLAKAQKLDPTNPRPALLEAQSKFYTPEAFGGGKKVALPIAEKAISLFNGFKASSNIMPNWGMEQATELLKQCK